MDDTGTAFEFSYGNRELSWRIDPIPITGSDMVDGSVSALAVTRSSAKVDSTVTLHPTGHLQRSQPKLAAMSPDLHVHTTPLAAANFHIKVGLPVVELSKREAQPHDGLNGNGLNWSSSCYPLDNRLVDIWMWIVHR